MNFTTGNYSDIGTTRATNQDSLCVMQAETSVGNVCMAIVCDGMGGLAKGEVASASVITEFARWFEEDLKEFLPEYVLDEIIETWRQKILYLSDRMKEYGMSTKNILGTTFSGILIINNQYVWMHVGDSRIYKMQSQGVMQMTSDHTVVAREVANGNMTLEEAAHSKLRSRLTQCVGASQILEPEVGKGTLEANTCLLLCSDGFYHRITEEELLELGKRPFQNEVEIDNACREAVKKVMQRGEKDNITVALIKSY